MRYSFILPSRYVEVCAAKREVCGLRRIQLLPNEELEVPKRVVVEWLTPQGFSDALYLSCTNNMNYMNIINPMLSSETKYFQQIQCGRGIRNSLFSPYLPADRVK